MLNCEITWNYYNRKIYFPSRDWKIIIIIDYDAIYIMRRIFNLNYIEQL